jgi:hypothetical protein
MRGRDWRRYQEKLKVTKRLKYISNHNYYYRYTDVNGNQLQYFKWIDFIGSDKHFMYKNYTTKNSKWKEKYGKKGAGYRRWPSDSKIGNRETNKIRFKKMLEEDYGIKHLNISYGFTKNSGIKQELDNI